MFQSEVEKPRRPRWWQVLLSVVGALCLLAFMGLMLFDYRLECSEEFIQTQMVKVLEKRLAEQESRAATQAARESECAEKLSRAACAPVKEHVTDAIKITEGKIRLGEDVAQVSLVASGEYRGRAFSAPLSGIIVPRYNASQNSIHVQALRLTAGTVTLDQGPPGDVAKRSKFIQNVGKLLKVDPKTWDDLVGWGAEKVEVRLKHGAEKLAIQTLEHIPVYTLKAKPTDPFLKRIAIAIAPHGIKSAQVEQGNLVVVISGSGIVWWVASVVVVGLCILALVLFLGTMGAVF